MDEVAKNIEKDIEVLEDKIQPYMLHDQDHYFQNSLMPENKERVLLLFSFEFEENLQQIFQSFDHQEYDNHLKQQEEILENAFYNPQVQEKVDSSCHFLHQPTQMMITLMKKWVKIFLYPCILI